MHIYYSSYRFLLGVGVGGEYPLAATVTSESSSAAKRGRLMAGVLFYLLNLYKYVQYMYNVYLSVSFFVLNAL